MALEQTKTVDSAPQANNEKVTIPDFGECWKELYFRSESAWAETFKELLSTNSFVDMMNHMLEQNLLAEKISRHNWSRYVETTPLPTKHDISRVAELIISLEEKTDTLEFSTLESMHSLADSLWKMVQHQEDIKQELAELRNENKGLKQSLDLINKTLTALSRDLPKKTKKNTAD